MAVYKLTKLAGASTVSYADATNNAIERAQKTLQNVEWWEVKELRGAVRDGSLEYQGRTGNRLPPRRLKEAQP